MKNKDNITKEDLGYALQLVIKHELSQEDYDILKRAWEIQEMTKKKNKEQKAIQHSIAKLQKI